MVNVGGGGAQLADALSVGTLSNSDGSLTISPSAGAVTASLNLAHANAWTAAQRIPASMAVIPAGPSQYTVLPSDDVVVASSSGGTFLVLLPQASALIGRRITIVKADAAGGTVQANANGGDTINGASTKAIAAQFESMALVSTSTGWFDTATGSGALSVSNSDSTLTITPNTGAVIASLNLGHANTWTVAQTFAANGVVLAGAGAGLGTLTYANSASSVTLTFPATTSTVAILAAQTFTGAQTFPASGIILTGSSTGTTTFASGNAGASNFTLTFPGVTDTVAVLGTAQSFTAAQTFANNGIILKGAGAGSGTFSYANSASSVTHTFPPVAGTVLNSGSATLAVAPSDPGGTTSTSAVMMGLGGGGTPAVFTPTISTRALITVSGQMANNTTNDGVTVQLRTGTGGVPANGNAVTGTQRGNSQTCTALVAAERSGFSIAFIVTGLAIGVQIWIDLALNVITAGTGNVFGVSITANEM